MHKDGRNSEADAKAPNAPDVSTLTDDAQRPAFDFQLRGPVYTPQDWYWKSESGRIYSSAREKIITEDDPEYQAWSGGQERIRAPTNWPRDADGKETDDSLREVLAAFGKKLP
jgi:hypothetical protein